MVLEVKVCVVCVLPEVDAVKFPEVGFPGGISEGKCVGWLEISVVSENSVSVISQGKVLWESEIKEFLDGEISAALVVLRGFPMEVLVCSFSEENIEVATANWVETGVFTKYVVDLVSTEVVSLLTEVRGDMVSPPVDDSVGPEAISTSPLLLKV